MFHDVPVNDILFSVTGRAIVISVENVRLSAEHGKLEERRFLDDVVVSCTLSEKNDISVHWTCCHHVEVVVQVVAKKE